MSVFDKVNIPSDMKELSLEQLGELCGELRNEIILQVAKNGGHFAANLGTVELAVALHYVYDAPRDKIIWDVGHQAYPHKLLTGRKEQFHTLKKFGGLSGFLKRDESEYDVFGAGHASTAISAALGVAQARDLNGEKFRVVSIVGDGALTGGLCFEAMNNIGHLKPNMLVVLNDNQIGIDKNVGSLNSYLNRLITGEFYNEAKKEMKSFIAKLPMGQKVVNLTHHVEEFTKGLVTPNIFFEELGLRYFGPVDGHDLNAMIPLLEKIRDLKGPALLHTITCKGKGYTRAEKDPIKWHGPTPFKIESGEIFKKETPGPKFTTVFAETLEDIAEQKEEIVAITAAMPTGTGLVKFSEKFPDRFYDVGIAEGHAVTFAAGLATEGIHPVVAVYSTFLQRAYDHIVHDVALQKLPVIFALDRGGLVGADGPTHHGVFDFAYLRMIPNMVVMAPKDEAELVNMMHTAANHKTGPIAFRYPRGNGRGVEMPEQPEILEIGKGEMLRKGERIAVLAIGLTVNHAMDAAEALTAEGIEIGVANMRFVKPLDIQLIKELADHYDHLITVEDHALMGGFGSAILETLETMGRRDVNLSRLGIKDEFAPHGNLATLYKMYGIHADSIAEHVRIIHSDKVKPIHTKPLSDVSGK